MGRRLFFLAALVLAMALGAGCARYEWHHPSKNQSDFNRDSYDCEYEATKATAYYAPSFVGQFEQAQQKNKVFEMCMRNKGYYAVQVKSSK